MAHRRGDLIKSRLFEVEEAQRVEDTILVACPGGRGRGGYTRYRRSQRALDDTSPDDEALNEELETPLAPPFAHLKDPEPINPIPGTIYMSRRSSSA